MLRPLRTLLPLTALCLGLSACSLLLEFDEEGQPCDDHDQCLPGYTCVDDKCVSDGTPTSDAGVDAGTGGDAGAGTDAGS
ncbi:hypothetical protein [Myxococcus sp. RHSTA-1-4]|uniref:hypothetical protein n=1 Tax=Myxococcus sp. RHSTA-1-4 TaxID=2874601 RepID=UPI001CBBECED|nr:hypothetical protein [Myxococcus sp. RHSTA-1-4]MBZ4419629.1 hypothetical protein [Myxococcus sp. RHSTA-1-4]